MPAPQRWPVQVMTSVSEETKEALEERAVAQGTSLSAIMRQAIDAFLAPTDEPDRNPPETVSDGRLKAVVCTFRRANGSLCAAPAFEGDRCANHARV